MADLNDSFDTLADTGFWFQIAVVAGSYMAGSLIKNTVEGRMGTDVPDEAYGVAVVLLATYFLSGDEQKFATMGGGLYTFDALAERLGIKSTVQNATGA